MKNININVAITDVGFTVTVVFTIEEKIIDKYIFTIYRSDLSAGEDLWTIIQKKVSEHVKIEAEVFENFGA